MLHKHLQTDIIRKDCLASTSTGRRAIHRRRHMRRRRVELGQQKSSLTASLVADDVPRNWESVDEEFLQMPHDQISDPKDRRNVTAEEG